MSQIYKFGYNIENKITRIFVFIGARLIEKNNTINLNKLFSDEPKNKLFEDIFSPLELSNVKKSNTSIYFIDEQIHPDDTIETVKKKLIKAIISELNISFGEIYLFAKKKKKMSAYGLYQHLTQNEKIELTNARLTQFLLNIDEIDTSTLETRDIYDYDDIIGLNIDNKEMLVDEPIGQKFISVETTFPYTVNPYNALVYDSFLERNAKEITITTNQNLLMSIGPISDNMIILCNAEDVFKYAKTIDLSEESTSKIYFPYLFEKEIINLSLLESEKQTLLVETTTSIEEDAFITNIDNINLFYNIFNGKTKNLEYTEVGIKQINFTLKPMYSFNLPLDTIFKLIHASENIPLIKFNPSKRQEKLYRLYTDKVATNGRKIPYLNKSTILKLIKEIGGNKMVAVYIEHKTNIDSIIPIMCEFESNGNINIKAKLVDAINIEELNTLINEAVNPVIDVVKSYLSQSGYIMNNFETIDSNNIYINEVDYAFKIPITKKLNLKSLSKCLSSIFSVISDDISKGAVLRFKRVAHYNEMDSQEAYIVEMLNKNGTETEIITGLMSNYNIKTETKARKKFADFVSSLQVMQTGFNNKKLKIKNNPGFLTTIVQDKFNPSLLINITGINDINYLNTIPIYIDSLLRITQEPNSTVVADDINNQCKGKTKIQNITHIPDIIAPAGKTQQQTQLNIIANELVFDKEDDEDNEDAGLSMLDILMMSDAEEDDDAEDDDAEDNDAEGEQEGGASPKNINNDSNDDRDDIKMDITGLSLSNPNPFFDKLQKREPTLFLTENEGGFSAYSRICPWNVRRQPIILTDNEKKNIDKNHKGSYDESIEYKSSKDGKKYHYICPRYWSIKDGVSLTEEQVKSGKYGSIIPQNAKKVPKGAGVFEFTSKKYHTGEDGKYEKTYPGFLKSDKHPDGLCIPCCFKAWNSNEQQKRREACSTENDDKTDKDQNQNILDEYIKGPDKFPLEPNRNGYLPLVLQRFLRTDNRKCQISMTNTNLRQNYPCILRHGVEVSKTQSFVACISDAWVDISKKATLSISEFKEVMIDAIDIDIFMTLQNGNLIDIFDSSEEVKLDPYKKSKIYKNTKINSKSKLSLLQKVARSYENFVKFLRDNTITIDYKYLWDLICLPNPKLFDKGLNLAIIELKEDDITSNVQLLCPSNYYAGSFFEANKPTLIIMKKGNYYEPIYSFEDKGDSLVITRQFSSRSIDSIKKTLELIKKSMNEKCSPLPSMPNIYKFGKNISLRNLVHLLKLKEFVIETQIINYNGKVIGLIANKEDKRGMIPCYPSSIIIDLTPSYTWMDDDIGSTYENTLEFLNYVYKLYSGRIPCKPKLKIIEDGLIVGILTQTNQFVPLSEPVQDTYGDDIPSIQNTNYALIDKSSISGKEEDKERIKYIKNIKLESSFYNVFRNSIKTLLSKFEYKKIRQDIENNINSPTLLYLDKLKNVDKLLRELTQNDIEFSKYSAKILSELTDVTNCHMISDDTCKTKKFCLSLENGNCRLKIPNKNLINGKKNEIMYFGRIADELIRYSRIKSFIFRSNTFLSFADIKYNLRENEIILLHSLLTQDYFDDIVIAPVNKYVNYNTYDTSQPLITQSYTSNIETTNILDDVDVATCGNKTTTIIDIKSKWKALLPPNSIELSFNNEPTICSFDIILTLIKATGKDNIITKVELKEILVTEYKKYDENIDKILDILVSQGKRFMTKKIKKGEITLENMIMSTEYYATNLDIWILAVKYNIPIIFISSTKLVENDKDILVAHTDGTNKYFFIRSPGVRNNNIPKYRLIVAPNNVSQIPITELSIELQNKIRENTKPDILSEFIENFKLTNFNNPNKKLVISNK